MAGSLLYSGVPIREFGYGWPTGYGRQGVVLIVPVSVFCIMYIYTPYRGRELCSGVSTMHA
ncbi:hypothetical protein LX36DRAFT_663516 [Colletotrichum falcatum]|nr:hypothetical protein LX36DRAFT_663516 [Colletotrichum falcatum]